jgi:Flp pilus assembly protein TadG
MRIETQGARAVRRLRAFGRADLGAAAAEFAIVATLLVYMLVNVVDLGMYVYARMQVENAAQAAAEKVFVACESSTTTDVTSKCSGVAGVITTAAQQTSLGTSVTAQIASTPGEGWYCSNGSGGMTRSSTAITAAQPNCLLTVLLNVSAAGDYLPITATYTYTPVFPGATVTSIIGTSISKTVWIRVV